MKKSKKIHYENARITLFKAIYSILFIVLLFFLGDLQIFKVDEFADKERIQGQRRILRPGTRGDITDRDGRLLIGNKADFSAIIHLDSLKNEIFKRKIALKKIAFEIRKELLNNPNLTLNYLLSHCIKKDPVKNRYIRLSGKYNQDSGKIPKAFWGNRRLPVDYSSKGVWSTNIIRESNESVSVFFAQNVSPEIKVDIAGLFSTSFFFFNQDYYPNHLNQQERPSFRTDSFSLSWEARYSVVNKYLQNINSLLNRNEKLSLSKLKNHWNKRLVLPMEIASGLTVKEYALLIEGLNPNSPVQVQSSSVRHYPEKEIASHVLGYVGSGYEANTDGLIGNDLATFQIKGKKGKSGIEKYFDSHLKGKDGSEIWRINPIGLRYDQIEKQSSGKGKPIQLTLDLDIQKIAESSLKKMSKKVTSYRVLPDPIWRKTIEKRTLRELLNSNENQISPELLLSAFNHAPFPIGAKEASTVAGFKGTEKDAEKLLRLLYSKGVLEKPIENENNYQIAKPPPPPGAAVILDVNTGEILALASIPNYNLESLSPRISQNTYDKIERQEAWLPRAWHPGYCPASPFKLVTAVAALRSKVVTPEEKLNCEGIYKGMICHCYPGKHGEMDLRKAEAQSCNVYFFQLAERLGQDTLIAEAKSFGMNQTPIIELPGLRNSPNVPDPEWKKRRVGENWALEDTFNVAIGQGGLRQSPLQMACFAAALAKNEKIFHPTLIKSKQKKRKPNPIGISDHFYDAIIDGMHQATINGTAKRCKIDSVDVAGKTGTAQWRNHNMKLSLAWFIGFAPVKNPEVAIAVLIEGIVPQDHIQGGLTATPVAKEILQAYFDKQNAKFAKNN